MFDLKRIFLSEKAELFFVFRFWWMDRLIAEGGVILTKYKA